MLVCTVRFLALRKVLGYEVSTSNAQVCRCAPLNNGSLTLYDDVTPSPFPKTIGVRRFLTECTVLKFPPESYCYQIITFTISPSLLPLQLF